MLFFGPWDAFAPLLIRRLGVRRFFLVCRRVGRLMVVRGSGVRRQRDASGVDVLDVFFQQLMSLSHRFGIFARYFLGDFLPSVRALDARDDTTNGHVSLVRSSTFSHVSSSSLSHASTPCISFVLPDAFASFAPCLSRFFRHFGQCGFESFVVFRTARLFTRQSFDSYVFVHVRCLRFHPLVRIVRTWIFGVGFLARVVDDGLASSTSFGWVEHEHAVRLHLLVSRGFVSIRVPIHACLVLRLFSLLSSFVFSFICCYFHPRVCFSSFTSSKLSFRRLFVPWTFRPRSLPISHALLFSSAHSFRFLSHLLFSYVSTHLHRSAGRGIIPTSIPRQPRRRWWGWERSRDPSFIHSWVKGSVLPRRGSKERPEGKGKTSPFVMGKETQGRGGEGCD